MSKRLRPLAAVFLWWHGLSAPVLLALSFVLLIGFGTAGLLLLPGLQRGAPLGFLDALFTMTSAVCVTGLVVVDTARHFTFAGQAWLLLFIQLGGLGLITLTAGVIGALGRRLSLRSEMITTASAELFRPGDMTALGWRVARAMFLIEGLGALALWLLWLPDFGPRDAVWHALFHSVSAFCNAGFSTLPDNLVGHARSPAVLLVLSALIIAGGIGYLSSIEWIRWYRTGGARGPKRLSTHTYAALVVTAILLVGGFAAFAVFEWNGLFAHLGTGEKLANAWFMSTTARTAGYNSVSYAQASNSSAYLTVLLMMVGGSPNSTAGGVKTTAFAVLAALALSRIKGRRFVALHSRTVPEGTVDRTVSMVLSAFLLVTAAVFVLSYTEARGLGVLDARALFLPLLFEAVSAFCTVGLSMDLTPQLSAGGKLVIILLMFIGRVGLLSFFAALSLRTRAELRDYRLAHEDLIVG